MGNPFTVDGDVILKDDAKCIHSKITFLNHLVFNNQFSLQRVPSYDDTERLWNIVKQRIRLEQKTEIN